MTAVGHLQHDTMNFMSAHVCLVGLVSGWIDFFHVDQAMIQVSRPKCELLSRSDESIRQFLETLYVTLCSWPCQ